MGLRGESWFSWRWIVILAGLVMASPAWGARVSLEMDVATLEEGQSTALRLVVTDGVLDRAPELSAPDGLLITYQQQSSSHVMVNFHSTSTTTYHYSVSALKVGVYQVGPVACQVDGRRLMAAPIALRVTERSQGARDAQHVEASFFPSPEPDEQGRIPLWVGQTVVYRFVFRHRQSVLDARWGAPEFEGFQAEPSAEQTQRDYQVQEGDVVWTVHEILVPLVAAAVGEFEIPPATLTVQVADRQKKRRQRSVFDDFFQPGFYTETRSQTLATEPLRVVIEPLPEDGRPDSFQGMVGRFHVSGELAAEEVATGDSLTFTVRITGDGTLAGVRLPAPPASDDFRMYDDEPEVVAEVKQDFQSRVVVKRAIVPLREGTFQVPRVTFSWFDPQEGRYEEQSVGGMSLSVASGEGAGPELASYGGGRVSRQDEVLSLADDILPIHTDIRVRNQVFRPGDPLLFSLVGLPACLFSGLVLWDSWRKGGQRGRRVRSLRVALSQLPESPSARLAALERGLREAVALVTGVNPPAVDSGHVRAALPPGLAGEGEALYRRLENARFGGLADDTLEREVVSWVDRLLRELA